MADPIDDLKDEQAIRAIKLFYDFSPEELWEEEEKPTPERVKKIVAALVEEAPADIQPAVAALAGDEQTGPTKARADVCRLMLRQLQQSPALRPTVDRAIDVASQPYKAIDPFTGAFIIALLLATTKVEYGPEGLKVHPGEAVVDAIKALQLPELLRELPPILKALPQGILDALIHHSVG